MRPRYRKTNHRDSYGNVHTSDSDEDGPHSDLNDIADGYASDADNITHAYGYSYRPTDLFRSEVDA